MIRNNLEEERATMARESVTGTRIAQTIRSSMRSDYNQHSSTQARIIEMFKPFLNSAVVALSPDLSSQAFPFVIADFGCSTGLNSSDAISHVIREVRNKYTMERCSSVLVVLNDLPGNHWSELFGFVHGDERSFMNEHRGVFAVAAGKSFFEQVLPDNSLHFGMSIYSLHWCSRLPVKIKSHCASVLGTEEERELFRQVATEDWSNFLKARSKELVSGGVLALSIPVAQEVPVHENIVFLDEYWQAAKTLGNRGIIDSDELLNFNLNVYARSLEEVTDKSLFNSLGLELLRFEMVVSPPSSHYESFLQHGDVQRFAREISGFYTAVFEPSFVSALSDKRCDEDKRRICEELQREVRARVVDHPHGFKLAMVNAFVVARKE